MLRQKAYTGINIAGLSVGIAATLDFREGYKAMSLALPLHLPRWRRRCKKKFPR
jgi:hypothetical protein